MLYICYSVDWTVYGREGDLLLFALNAPSERHALSLCQNRHLPQIADCAILCERNIVPEARCSRAYSPGLDWYFSAFWMRDQDDPDAVEECAYLFKSANATSAAKNMYLHRFSMENLSLAEVQQTLQDNDCAFDLTDIDEDSFSDIVEEHIDAGTGGYSKYHVSHFIAPVAGLPLAELVRIPGKSPAEEARKRMARLRKMMKLWMLVK